MHVQIVHCETVARTVGLGPAKCFPGRKDAWSFFKLLDEDAGGAVEIEECPSLLPELPEAP